MLEPFVRAHSLLEKNKYFKISTGNSDLDGLLGSIESGTSYLFYGDEPSLSLLVHHMMVNGARRALSSSSDFHIIYINNTDYYSHRTLLDVDLLGALCKRSHMDPYLVFNGISVFAAYSPGRQLEVAKQVSSLVKALGSICMIVFHNPACFMGSERTRESGLRSLSRSFVEIWQASMEAGATLVTTSPAYESSPDHTPEAAGSRYLRHLSIIVAYFERVGSSKSHIEVTLTKHPSRPTPASALVDLSQEEVNYELGRVTPPFHMLYDQMVKELRERYQLALIDADRRTAFDSLLDEAWFPEQAAMNNSFLPSVIDQLNLTANVDNRRLINELLDRIRSLEAEVDVLKKRLGET